MTIKFNDDIKKDSVVGSAMFYKSSGSVMAFIYTELIMEYTEDDH